MNDWWKDLDTRLKDIVIHPDGSITSLHAKNINGIFQHALVWWHYGRPQLHLLVADGVILFDIDPSFDTQRP